MQACRILGLDGNTDATHLIRHMYSAKRSNAAVSSVKNLNNHSRHFLLLPSSYSFAQAHLLFGVACARWTSRPPPHVLMPATGVWCMCVCVCMCVCMCMCVCTCVYVCVCVNVYVIVHVQAFQFAYPSALTCTVTQATCISSLGTTTILCKTHTCKSGDGMKVG
jgi:hypothetical protein